ncbi:Aminotransferase class I and II [Fragilaria crotonensis]|nr:Aminotransferase class I and II [Fragilaria crotonensis]
MRDSLPFLFSPLPEKSDSDIQSHNRWHETFWHWKHSKLDIYRFIRTFFFWMQLPSLTRHFVMSQRSSLALKRLIMSPCWVMPSSALKAAAYLADARAVTRYSPSTPDGALQLGVAENQMLEDLLVPALNEFGANTFTADCIYYQPTQGRPALREAFCLYLQRLLNLSKPLDPDGLIMGTGCNAVLENLCITLAEPGEGVLIPTPYYAAFEFDLVARAGLSILPVNTFEHSGATIPPVGSEQTIPVEAYYPTKAGLSAAYLAAKHEGESPRILLLPSKQPARNLIPPHIVQDCIDWFLLKPWSRRLETCMNSGPVTFDENHTRLRARCDALQRVLEEFNVPHLSANSGLFAGLTCLASSHHLILRK